MAEKSGKKAKAAEIEEFDLTMMSNFIHQVINPLNGVAGTLDNLAEGRIEGAHRQEHRLTRARAQLEQCITLVRNLAFFAQGFGALDPNITRAVVIPQVIIEAAGFFQEDAANKSIRIHLKDKSGQNKVAGHHELIQQVFMNLFDNAVKYSAPGSEVFIDQRVQKRSGNIIIEVNSRPNDPILTADLKKLFELGFRGANARKIIASGTGLGLYICKRIIEDVHGGKITAGNVNHGQLQFLIVLPAAS